MSTILEMINSRVSMDVGSQPEAGDHFLEMKIPEERHRDEDLKMEMCLYGNWQQRRVILSKEKLSFAFFDDDNEIDYVPLSEIESVSDAKEFTEAKTEGIEHEMGYILTVQITTRKDGYNSGRTYFLRAETNDVCQNFTEKLRLNVKEAKKRAMKTSRMIRFQHKVKKIYDSDAMQGFIALIIMANFACTIVEAEEVDKLSHHDDYDAHHLSDLLDQLNLFFTFIFLVDLLVNAFAHWFKEFSADVWNYLDMIIVAMSLLSVVVTNQPTGIVRIMRALRVIRLFGRLKALKKIIAALSLALLPVLNVFLILFLLLSIGAVVGVTLFHEEDPADFAVFSVAFFTLFHVTAGEPWPHSLHRLHEDGSLNWTVAMYTMIYTVIVAWVILEVSVAVLLDNFISASTQMALEERLLQAKNKHQEQQLKSPLEPLLMKLAREFIDNQDLSNRLQKLYAALDTDKSGSLDSMEFCSAIKRLDFTPRIHISDSDFDQLTQNGDLCNEKGHLGPEEFEMVMRKQIRHMAQSRLSLVSDVRSPEETDFMLHGSLKMIFMEQTRMEKVLEQTAADVRNILSCVPGGGRFSPGLSPPTPRTWRSRNASFRKAKSLSIGASNALAVAETLKATADKLQSESDGASPPPAALPPHMAPSAEELRAGRDTNPRASGGSHRNSTLAGASYAAPPSLASGNPAGTPRFGERSPSMRDEQDPDTPASHNGGGGGSHPQASLDKAVVFGSPDSPRLYGERHSAPRGGGARRRKKSSSAGMPPPQSSAHTQAEHTAPVHPVSNGHGPAGTVRPQSEYSAPSNPSTNGHLAVGITRAGPGDFASLAEFRETPVSLQQHRAGGNEARPGTGPEPGNSGIKNGGASVLSPHGAVGDSDPSHERLGGEGALRSSAGLHPAAAASPASLMSPALPRSRYGQESERESGAKTAAQRQSSPGEGGGGGLLRSISSDSDVSVDSALGFSLVGLSSRVGGSSASNGGNSASRASRTAAVAASAGFQV